VSLAWLFGKSADLAKRNFSSDLTKAA
jgi:hypothetical protein